MGEIEHDLDISEAIVHNLWNSFNGFEKNTSGAINAKMVPTLFQKMHVNLPDNELKMLAADLGKDTGQPTCTLQFKEILYVFSKCHGAQGQLLDVKMEHLAAQAREQMDRARQTTMERAALGVPRKWIVRYIRGELKEEESCEQLPWAAALLILFITVSLLHLRSDMVVTIQKSIEFDMMENANFAFEGAVPFENGRMGHKTFYDVNSIGDFWSFVNLGLLPLVYPEEYPVSEARASVLAVCTSTAEQLKPWAKVADNFSVSASTSCDETIHGNGADYRGCQSRTSTGRACQKWSSQVPHTHNWGFHAKLGKELGDHNFCRNPNGESTIWCYTTSSTTWEFCTPRIEFGTEGNGCPEPDPSPLEPSKQGVYLYYNRIVGGLRFQQERVS